jgi:hypothetical protein
VSGTQWRTGSGRLGGAGSGDGLGLRSGTGSLIGSTTIFLSGFPISMTCMTAPTTATRREARTSVGRR